MRRWLVFVALLGALLLTGGVRREVGSEERGNRLFRKGQFGGAAQVYRRYLKAAGAPVRLHYNLGTALLGLEPPDAASAELKKTLEGTAPDIAWRGSYNLGFLLLRGALGTVARDTAMSMAVAAVEANKTALRLHPQTDDARWNLAVAQRTVDSLAWLALIGEQEAPSDTLLPPDQMESEVEVLSMAGPGGNLGGAGNYSRGEKEAMARSGMQGPLSAQDAAAILTNYDQTPEHVLQRIFIVASPNRWGGAGIRDRQAW